MSFSSIVLAVMVLAAVIAVISAVYARMSAKDAAKAAKAMHEASQRAKMLEAFEVACKQALLHDASVKAIEVKLGKRAATGTKLMYGKV